MTMIEKGLALTAGVVFVGLIGYKIIKKKKPDMLKKAKCSASNIKNRTKEVIEGAKASFREGYAKA